MPENRVLEVVAALIWRGDHFLIAQRPPHKMCGGLWEFVGGKVEPGESGAQAIVRECCEELGITLCADRPFMDVIHPYPEMTVHLTLYESVILDGEPQRLEHSDIRWITVQEIDEYSFCPADQEICEEIKRRIV